MRPKSHHPRRESERTGKIYIYGRHALAEALRGAPHVVRKAFIAPDNRDKELRDLLAKHKIPTAELEAGRGRDFVGNEAHQGVIATIDPTKLVVSLDDFIATLDMTSDPAVVLLGEVQDPHNVGAIIRSAAGFGLAGVLIPEHRQAPITGAVVKSSAGMAFRIPLVSVGNVNQALATLKKKGFWTYGLAMQGEKLSAVTFDVPACFVVGNEGAGIREKTLATCDIALSIPMHERTESLNAAVSAGVVFYEWSKQRPSP